MSVFDCLAFRGSKGAMIKFIGEYLLSNGYLIIKNHPISERLPERDFLKFCLEIGNPVQHNSKNSIVWDIRARNSNNDLLTFSETCSEAALHTDSQYRNTPEEFFALLCISPAKCGGGVSLLLKLDDVLEDLNKLQDGGIFVETLRKQKFPFKVPSVFIPGSDGETIVLAHILKQNEIRFRADTIEQALIEMPELDTVERRAALNKLKSILLESKKIQSIYLQKGEILLVNNKSVLHGRTSFMDKNRHLLRIRMNFK